MNKKQLNKIKSIYREGCPEHICIRVISAICAAQGKSHIEVGAATYAFIQWVEEQRNGSPVPVGKGVPNEG